MKSNAGFTLIEMICSIVIVAILAVLIAGYLNTQSQLFYFAATDQDVNQNVRVVLERMGNEIRQAATMTVTSTTDFTFTADIDADGINETVRYYLSGTDLHKTVDAADQLVLDNVSALNCLLRYTNKVFTVQTLTVSTGGVSRSYSTSFLMRRTLS